MKNIILESFSSINTEKIGFEIAQKFCKSYKVFALYGILGAGKTTFVRGFASALGIKKREITSPTFSIMNKYEGKICLNHFDMYRINSYQSLVSTGFFDILDEGITIVEWSENIKDFLPKNIINIKINVNESFKRLICIEGRI